MRKTVGQNNENRTFVETPSTQYTTKLVRNEQRRNVPLELFGAVPCFLSKHPSAA